MFLLLIELSLPRVRRSVACYATENDRQKMPAERRDNSKRQTRRCATSGAELLESACHIKRNIIHNQTKKIMSEIEAKVKAIIVDKLSVDEAEVKNEASFANDLGADSLDTVELIMEFEKQFGITIPDDQSEKISTVGDAIAYIEEHTK